MSNQETLHFKIGISGTHWGKKPAWRICVDQQEMAAGEVDTEVKYVEFDCSLASGTHRLSIHLTNKLDSDVQKDNYDDPDNYNIINDLLLHIKSIEIDEIDLNKLYWEKSKFVSEDATRPVLTNCIDLGWNGEWQLEFDSPFYIWLLENI
jgi:hypothetical protein